MHFLFVMSGLSVVFRFMQIVSVVAIALRMISFWESTSLFPKQVLPKIGTIMVGVLIAIEVSPLPSEFWRWLCLVILLVGFQFVCEWSIFQRENRFREQWIFYLERLLLRMRGGVSIRAAIEKLESEEEGFFRAKLAQIRAAVVFSQHGEGRSIDPQLAVVVEELRQATQQPHQSIRRITNLRRKLAVEVGFRRKSGQATFQMRIQAGILAGLYLAMLCFVVFRDRTQIETTWLLGSLALFAVGTLWLLRIGKRIKWKV